MPHEVFLDSLRESLLEQKQKYGADDYWFLRRIRIEDFSDRGDFENLDRWNARFPRNVKLPGGYAAFVNLLSFLLLMRVCRSQGNELINEDARGKYRSWNDFFRSEFLYAFPAVTDYTRMYAEAERLGILDTLFPGHGANRFPIVTILNYSGYIYLRLLERNVDLKRLSQYCLTPEEELREIQKRLEEIRNAPALDVEDIAEELQIPESVAKRLYEAFGPVERGGNFPRICRRDGKLVYLLPNSVDFGTWGADEVLYRFDLRNESRPIRVRYRKIGAAWRPYLQDPGSLDLSDCVKITVRSKSNGIDQSEAEELEPVYIFEGNSEKPRKKLRSGTHYTCLKSGLCPQGSQIVVESPDGTRQEFHDGSLPAGSRLMLLNPEGETLLAYDVDSGNEISLIFGSRPVNFVSKRDIPCFSMFPELDINADNAEIFINGRREEEVDVDSLYGEASVTVKCGDSTRTRRCRVLPSDFKIFIAYEGESESPFDPREPLDFACCVDFFFRSEHLQGKEKEVAFRLDCWETGVEVELELDNHDTIPIKFDVLRTQGAYISLTSSNGEEQRIPFVKETKSMTAFDWEDFTFDWEDFKEHGALHFSRDPNQTVTVSLHWGEGQGSIWEMRRIAYGKFRDLAIDWADLCDMVNNNEAELLTAKKISVVFQGEGREPETFSLACRASSLEKIEPSIEEQNLVLTFPYASQLPQEELFLILKKVEDQAGENILVLPEKFDRSKIEVLKKNSSISEAHCMWRFEKSQSDRTYARVTVRGFRAPGQWKFPAKAFLGFVLRPGENSGFIRCTQGFFVPTDWDPSNDRYFRSLMCGKAFLNNRCPESIRALEEKFAGCDKQVREFIDKVLEFGRITQALPFMDVCYHPYAPSGYMFLAAGYWLEKLGNGEPVDELTTYWDPELFSIGSIETALAADPPLRYFEHMDESYKDSFPTLYWAYCRKNNINDGESSLQETWETAKEEILKVSRDNFLTPPTLGLRRRHLKFYAENLFRWRKKPSLVFKDFVRFARGYEFVFHELRDTLQTLRTKYPMCYRYVARLAWLRHTGDKDQLWP